MRSITTFTLIAEAEQPWPNPGSCIRDTTEVPGSAAQHTPGKLAADRTRRIEPGEKQVPQGHEGFISMVRDAPCSRSLLLLVNTVLALIFKKGILVVFASFHLVPYQYTHFFFHFFPSGFPIQSTGISKKTPPAYLTQREGRQAHQPSRNHAVLPLPSSATTHRP